MTSKSAEDLQTCATYSSGSESSDDEDGEEPEEEGGKPKTVPMKKASSKKRKKSKGKKTDKKKDSKKKKRKDTRQNPMPQIRFLSCRLRVASTSYREVCSLVFGRICMVCRVTGNGPQHCKFRCEVKAGACTDLWAQPSGASSQRSRRLTPG